MNDIDRVFDLGEVGDRRPAPPDGDGPRSRPWGRASAMIAVFVVAGVLAVASIRVIEVGRPSSGIDVRRDAANSEPKTTHETLHPYELPDSGFVPYPADPLPTDVLVDLRTGEFTELPRRIRSISGADANYDISPNGTVIAFEAERGHRLLGARAHQLWVAEIDGTHAHKALDRSMIAMTPAWSPDGAQIVFEGAHEDLFVVDVASRSVREVFEDRGGGEVWLPSFRPDGRAILFTRSTHGGRRLDLWAVPVGGGAPTLVRANAAFGTYSPDGSTIAFHRIGGRGADYWFPFDFGISLLDTASGERRGLHVKNAGCCHMAPYDWSWTRPVWSADGSMLAFQAFGERRGDIHVVDVSTREVSVIGEGAYPTWLDDHTLILEDYDEPEDGVPTPLARVELGDVDAMVDLRTDEVTALPQPIVRLASSEPHYAVSPDGSHLAFVGITPSDGYRILIANLDGTDLRAVTTDASLHASPAWSPDGTEIVYEAGGYDEHDLAVVDLRTGRTRPVILGPSGLGEWAWAPSFSPDGEAIVFTVRSNSEDYTSDLWSVPASGGRPVRLLRDAALAAYSPDGSSIAYRRARSMMSAWVQITNAAGHNPVHVGGSGWFWRPVWPILGTPAWSPDGTQIAFESGLAGSIVVADAITGQRRVVGAGERPTWLDDHTLIVEAVP